MRKLSICIIIFLAQYNSLSSAEGARKLTLLVQPFMISSDKSFLWAAEGISDSVASDLERISSINTVTGEDRIRALHDMKSLTAMPIGDDSLRISGLLCGADFVVTGNCSVKNNLINITLKIISSGTGEVTALKKIDGTVDGIFKLQDNIVFSLIDEISKLKMEGVIPPVISNEDKIRIASKTTPALKTYELYSRALITGKSNVNEALLLCDKAIEAQPDYYEASILGAYLENISGHPSIALARIQRAKAVLKRRGRTSDITMAFIEMNRAPVLFALKRYRESLSAYGSAKLIFEKASMIESSNYISILIGMGISQRGMGNNTEALKLFNQANRILEKLGMAESIVYGWALFNTGIVYSDTENFNEAEKTFTKASKVFISAGLSCSEGTALTDGQLGFIFYKTGKFDDSLKYFLSSVNIASKMKSDNDENYAWYNWYIAQIYFDQKSDAGKAIPYMQRSVEIFKNSGSPEFPGASDYLNKIRSGLKK